MSEHQKEQEPDIRTFDVLRVRDPYVIGRSVPLKYDASKISTEQLEKIEKAAQK